MACTFTPLLLGTRTSTPVYSNLLEFNGRVQNIAQQQYNAVNLNVVLNIQ